MDEDGGSNANAKWRFVCFFFFGWLKEMWCFVAVLQVSMGQFFFVGQNVN